MLAGMTAVAILLASTAAASPARVANLPCDPNCGPADLRIAGTMDSATAAVGDSLTWRLTVTDVNQGPATGVYVDVTVPSNVTVTYTYADRGTGCTGSGTNTWHCDLDWLADTAQNGHIVITAKVTATGDHALTAVAGYRAPDPAPGDNTVTLTATTPGAPVAPVAPVAPAAVTAVVAAGVGSPPNQTAGKLGAVTFLVTRSDNGAAMTDGTVTSSVTVGGKAVTHLQTYTNGVAQVSYSIPAKTRGKILTVKLTVKTTTGASTSKVSTYVVH
jgi:Domain of unknown function DUF11